MAKSVNNIEASYNAYVSGISTNIFAPIVNYLNSPDITIEKLHEICELPAATVTISRKNESAKNSSSSSSSKSKPAEIENTAGTCSYVFKKGDFEGKFCTKKRAEGTEFCNAHGVKKTSKAPSKSATAAKSSKTTKAVPKKKKGDDIKSSKVEVEEEEVEHDQENLDIVTSYDEDKNIYLHHKSQFLFVTKDLEDQREPKTVIGKLNDAKKKIQLSKSDKELAKTLDFILEQEEEERKSSVKSPQNLRKLAPPSESKIAMQKPLQRPGDLKSSTFSLGKPLAFQSSLEEI